MGLFGVIREKVDDLNPSHQFSVLSPSDFSVSQNLDLPFDKDEYVYGGSCGDVLYFYSEWGKTVIFSSQNNEPIVVPPPELLAHNYDARTRGRGGKLNGCGVSYDAKSGDYKVIRKYDDIDYKDYCDLYSVSSRSAKAIMVPSRKCVIHRGTSIYVEAAGSCYWVARLYDDKYDYPRDDPLFYHVLKFDFASECFDQFALPGTGRKGFSPEFKVVECRGSLGVLVHWIQIDDFSVDGCQCHLTRDCQCFYNLCIRLFVRNGKGTSWDLLYDDVSVADGFEPIGLKDDRVLFVAARQPRGEGFPLMVYYLASKTLKKLDVCIRDPLVYGIYFGEKKKKNKNKNKNKNKKGKGM